MFTSGNQGTLYRIMAAPATNPAFQTDPNAYTPIQEWSEEDLIAPAANFNIWTQKTVSLSGYAGTSIYIAFVRVYNQTSTTISGDRWLIDNVGMYAHDPCALSTAANYTSPTTVAVSWPSPEPVEIMILPCGDPDPTPADTGIAITSSTTYQFTNLIPDNCYKVFIKNSCPVANTWHRIFLAHQYAPIHLVAFTDSNNNGIKDSEENLFSTGSFTIRRNNTGPTSYISSYSGLNDFIPDNLNDTFDFGFIIDPSYSQCLNLGSFNFNDIAVSTQTAQTLYFPVVPIPGCFDDRISLSASVPPRPGTNDSDFLTISTIGTNPSSTGTLTYTKAPQITTVSVIPSTGITYTPTGFTYAYSGLSANTPITLQITTSVPFIPVVNLGEGLTSSASITVSASDINPSNNSHSITQTIVGSYDPNDISELHGPQIQFNQFGANDYLYYTIRFQNTGNANAIKVLVNDALDTRIDEASIGMISTRHDYRMIRNGNAISWEFNNIQLPPASVNEDLSNGFIIFRVKPKPGFAVGDIIPSVASIYFDSNPAIITNTFNTEFVQALGNPTFDSNSISLYPNPAGNTVTITNDSPEKITRLTVYDITGKRIYSLKNNSPEATRLDVSHFAKGIYFVELTSEKNHKTTKKLLLK